MRGSTSRWKIVKPTVRTRCPEALPFRGPGMRCRTRPQPERLLIGFEQNAQQPRARRERALANDSDQANADSP